MRPRLFLAIALASSSALSAQSSVFIPDSQTGQKPCNAIPFGSFGIYGFPTNLKYQTLVPWTSLARLARPVIEEIGFVPCSDGIGSFKTIKIQMALVTSTKLVSEFSKNLGTSPVTVLDSANYYWHQKKDKWCPIGLQRSFGLKPGSQLVIDIEVTGAVFLSPALAPSTSYVGGHRASASVPRLIAIGWKSAPPVKGKLKGYGLKIELSASTSDLSLFGIGCKGAGSKRPTLGLSGDARPSGIVQVALSNGLPSGATSLVLGFDNKAPFPVPLGFPECSLYQSIGLALPATADPSGGLKVPIPLPASPVLQNQRFYVQFFQVELTRSGLGLRASNYGRVLIR